MIFIILRSLMSDLDTTKRSLNFWDCRQVIYHGSFCL